MGDNEVLDILEGIIDMIESGYDTNDASWLRAEIKTLRDQVNG